MPKNSMCYAETAVSAYELERGGEEAIMRRIRHALAQRMAQFIAEKKLTPDEGTKDTSALETIKDFAEDVIRIRLKLYILTPDEIAALLGIGRVMPHMTPAQRRSLLEGTFR